MQEPEEKIPCLRRGWRAEVGILTMTGAVCREWEIVAPDGVRFSTALLDLPSSTPAGYKKMASRQIEVEAKKLNRGHRCDLICFGCTAGSFIGGLGYDQQLIDRIEKASGSPATTTVTCVLGLLRDMSIKKMSIVGPYTDEVFDEEVKFFKANGIDTVYVRGSGLQLSDAREFYNYRWDPYRAYKLVRDGTRAVPGADCVFITCMASTIIGVVDILEKEIGKPVISSLSATLYGILKKLGIPDPVYHYGEALRRPRIDL